METKRAIGYIRVSTDRQAETGHSLENQEGKIRAYCEFSGIELKELIKDEGLSGRNTNRPGFRRLMQCVASREADVVVVYSLSRFARNTRAMLEAVDTMVKSKVEFHSLSEKIDTATATGKFFLTIISAMAEMESMQTSERVRDVARDRKGKQKTYVGSLYGFDKVNGDMVPNSEMESIRRIYDMKKSGCPMGLIATKFNTEGVPTKKGATWHTSTIKQILNNSVYQNHVTA